MCRGQQGRECVHGQARRAGRALRRGDECHSLAHAHEIFARGRLGVPELWLPRKKQTQNSRNKHSRPLGSTPCAAHLAGDARMRSLSGNSGMPCESRGGGGAIMEVFKFVCATGGALRNACPPLEFFPSSTRPAGSMCRRCGEPDVVLKWPEGEGTVEVSAVEARAWRSGPGEPESKLWSSAQLQGRMSLQPVFAGHTTGRRGCTSSHSAALCGNT